MTGFLIFFPEHPWPRPDLQGLSSMVTASEVFQPQNSVPCNSRQGRPVYPVQKMGFPILSSSLHDGISIGYLRKTGTGKEVGKEKSKS